MLELRRRYGSSAGGGQPSRLPAGYQEVEYLENTGTQYITLPIGYGFSGDIKVKMSVHRNVGSGYRIITGWNDGPQIALRNGGGSFYWHNYNTTDIAISLDAIYNTRLKINGSASSLYVNETNVVNNSTFNNSSQLGLFNFANNSGSTSLNGRIYEVEINGTSNLHLIPCRRLSDNEKGMYDIVNDVFYTNAGTGEFLCGADVGSEEANPSYIQVPIGAWLHTGIIASGDLTFELTFSYVYIYDGLQPDWIFFSRISSSSGLFGILNGQNGAALGIRYGTNPTGLVYDFISDTSKHTIKFGKGKFYLDGVLLHEQDRQNFTSVELLLSNANAETNVISEYAKNYYSVRAYDINDNLTHDYIPAIKDGEAGLYDTISGTFQKNAGDGVIIAY